MADGFQCRLNICKWNSGPRARGATRPRRTAASRTGRRRRWRTRRRRVLLRRCFVRVTAVIGDVKTGSLEDETGSHADLAPNRSGAAWLHAFREVRVLHRLPCFKLVSAGLALIIVSGHKGSGFEKSFARKVISSVRPASVAGKEILCRPKKHCYNFHQSPVSSDTELFSLRLR